MESPATAPESAAVRLRSYQKEMLDASLCRNIIVAMDTGSGKTHVAIARIAAELERSPGKLVFFLVPSVALADQQSIALSAGLPAYAIRTLTGRDGVEKWTSQVLWDAVLTNIHVVVCTPAVLLDALTHGFVTMARLSLCVFDEAHRATKNHPMNAILQSFYHPAKQLGHVPHILGLTASPVTNSKKGSLEILEHNLDAISATPKHTRTELENYVNPPEVTTVLYASDPDDGFGDPLCCALAQEARLYDFHTDPYVLELSDKPDERSAKSLREVLTKQATYCSTQLRTLDRRAASISQQFGMPMSRWYVEECLSTFQRGLDSNDHLIPDLSGKEQAHLSAILSRIQMKSQLTNGQALSKYSHKMSQLITILKAHASDQQSAIIFVEQRVHTIVLAHLLKQLPEINKTDQIGTFVGTSTSSKRHSSLADILERKEQQKDLDDFRAGRKNLMIATSVLEEGIDVSACGLVICFDPPKNLVSFVQRRGRARQTSSKYFIFIPEDDLKPSGTQWESLEAVMKRAYMDGERQLTENIGEECSMESMTYCVPSTGALLTLENAKGHLYHFCSVGIRQSTHYVDLRPEFDTVQDLATKLWTARVELPAFVHPDVRYAASSKPWKTEVTAVKEAAFQAYVSLHKSGLLNDNLLPLVKDYGPDIGQQHLDQPRLLQVSERMSWRAWWARQDPSVANWSQYTITIEQNDTILVTADLLLPSCQISIGSIALHWNASTIYYASLQQVLRASDSLDASELAVRRHTSQVMLRAVHSNRMLSFQDDLTFLIAPDQVDLEAWLQDVKGSRRAADLRKRLTPSPDVGLVRVNGQVGRSFFFNEFVDSESAEPVITATTFPKRKDFLSPIALDAAGAAAHTGEQRFPVSDCTLDNLPSKYAVLAAFIPSILYRVDTMLLVHELQKSLLVDVGIEDSSVVHEAITSPAASNILDYNRLEYLGDTVLKHCTHLQVISTHPTWPEAYLTIEKGRIVRNSNLATAALELGLDKFIITKPFEGNKWRPMYISQVLEAEQTQREMSTKTLADVMEAIMGAAFVEGGFNKAQKCIAALLPTETWHEPAVLLDGLVDELRPRDNDGHGPLERLIGHEFKHPATLTEAVTHASYLNIQSGLSYERLEFLGDSVLDMIVTPKLFNHPRKLRHWDLHRVHEALVNSYFVGYCCMRYAIEEDIFNVVERPSGQYDIKQSNRQIHLHDFLRAGRQLTSLRLASLTAFDALNEEIHQALTTSNRFPWPALVTLNPQKFFCDMVESVLGAIYIDTRGDFSVCEEFVRRLGILDYMQRILDDCVETLSPKERLGVVAVADAVRYVNRRTEGQDGTKSFSCTVSVGERDIVTVDGCRSKNEAEVKAANRACELLGDRVGVATRENKKKRKMEVAVVREGVKGEENETRVGPGGIKS